MAVKYGVLFLTLLAGSLAIPSPQVQDDMSEFFSEFDSSTRIVGGTVAAVGSHPHMVALTTGSTFKSQFCGGSLVSPRSVVTAAHCIAAVWNGRVLTSSLRVTVGTNRWSSGGQSYTVSRNVTHSNYLSSIIKNDIGLFITNNNVVLSNRVQPIPISFEDIPGGVTARVAGWGSTRVSGSGGAASDLIEITLPTISRKACEDGVAKAKIEINRNAPPTEQHIEICTYHSAGRGTCRGDSGSALARVSDGSQIGVVSWGFPCARGAPDMFVRVSAFRQWFEQNLV